MAVVKGKVSLKDYKINKNDQEGPHISVKTYMAEDRLSHLSQEVETIDMNLALVSFGWI